MAIDKDWKRLKADEMRANPTPPEAFLWGALETAKNVSSEHEQMDGMCHLYEFQFERQVIVHGWIPDFYCEKAKLIIEVDGKYHQSQKQSDKVRDEILLEKYGIRTLRFTSEELYADIFNVLRIIDSALDEHVYNQMCISTFGHII